MGTSNPYILVDTAEGKDGFTPVLEDALTSVAAPQDAGLPDVSDIILSHWHGDHIGGLPSLLPLLSNKTTPSVSTYQQLDSGICIGSGCAFCGWSVLLENPGRRKELGLFVVPRALASLLPRRYEWEKRGREKIAFASAVAVVFTCVGERPERVRGVFGKVLRSVLVQ